ncbi:MAG: hypothetical protein AAFW00_22835 [Bacteroidota bacterium]
MSAFLQSLFRPSFMRKIDATLCRNQPHIWRTQIHWVIFYAGIIGLPLTFLLAYGLPLSTPNLPSAWTRGALFWILQIGALSAMGAWIWQQFNLKVETRQWPLLLGIGGIYMVGLMLIQLNVWTFHGTYYGRMASLKSELKVQKSEKFLSGAGIIGDVSWQVCDKPKVQVKKFTEDILQEFGFDIQFVDLHTDPYFPRKGQCYQVLRTEAVDREEWERRGANYWDRSSMAFSVKAPLENFIYAMNEAHAFQRGEGKIYERTLGLWYYAALVALLLAGGMVAAGMGKTSQDPNGGNSLKWTFDIKLPFYGMLREMDARLAVHRPYKWGGALHYFRLYTFLPIVTVLMGGYLILYYGFGTVSVAEMADVMEYAQAGTVALLVLGTLGGLYTTSRRFYEEKSPWKNIASLTAAPLMLAALGFGYLAFQDYYIGKDQVNLDKNYQLTVEHVYEHIQKLKSHWWMVSDEGDTEYIVTIQEVDEDDAWQDLVKYYGFDRIIFRKMPFQVRKDVPGRFSHLREIEYYEGAYHVELKPPTSMYHSDGSRIHSIEFPSGFWTSQYRNIRPKSFDTYHYVYRIELRKGWKTYSLQDLEQAMNQKVGQDQEIQTYSLSDISWKTVNLVLPVLLFLFHLSWLGKYFYRRESWIIRGSVLFFLALLVLGEVYLGWFNFFSLGLLPLSLLLWMGMTAFNFMQVDANTHLTRIRKGFLFVMAPLMVMSAQPFIWMMMDDTVADMRLFLYYGSEAFWLIGSSVLLYVGITYFSLQALIKQKTLPM